MGMVILIIVIGLIAIIKCMINIYADSEAQEYKDEYIDKKERNVFNQMDYEKHYDHDCFKRNTLFIWISFFGGLIFGFMLFSKFSENSFNFTENFDSVDYIIWGLPSLCVACVCALIATAISSAINIKIGENIPIDYNNERLQKERLNLKAAIIGGITAISSIVHKTKKAADDICNVDNWDKMK